MPQAGVKGTIRKAAPEDRTEGDPTAGMVREEAFRSDRVWAGLVRIAPRQASGWHHHGDTETTVYRLSGALRVEFGPKGNEVLDSKAGDFVSTPPRTIHRDSNPTDEETQLIVVRSGDGPPTINVEGPDG